jgi:hypothetical protein
MPRDEAHISGARPAIPAVAFFFAAGVLLIGSTFLDVATFQSTSGGVAPVTIGAWGIDIGSGQPAAQYNGIPALVVGVALILVAAASLHAGFRWTRSTSLVIGGIGVGTGLSVAAAGLSASTFLSRLLNVAVFYSSPYATTSPPAGPGIWLTLLAGLLALAAVVWPPRRDVVPPAEEPTAPPTDAGWFGDGSGKTD